MTLCKYCSLPENKIKSGCLTCIECNQKVHVTCLKKASTPGAILGDVFFIYTCHECSPISEELFLRDKMSWFHVITLALYDLTNRSHGNGRKGYFHWKIHISSYIDKNWHILFKKDFKRKKKWIGTVSGTLSFYSPYFFQSGTDYFGESGWWKLTYPYLSPEVVINLNAEIIKLKQKNKDDLKKKIFNESEMLEKLLIKYNYKQIEPKVENPSKKIKIETETNVVSDDLTFLNNSGSEKLSVSEYNVDVGSFDDWKISSFLPEFDENLLFEDLNNIENDINIEDTPTCSEKNLDNISSRASSFDIESFISYDDLNSVGLDENSQESTQEFVLPEKSLFNKTETVKEPWKTEEKSSYEESSKATKSLTTYEESQILKKADPDLLSPHLRRVYTKLRLRKEKRECGLPLFNIDNLIADLTGNKNRSNNSENIFLDRYCKSSKNIIVTSYNSGQNEQKKFAARILGFVQPSPFFSPYTNRILKPYIRRDNESKPLWLKLMNELQIKVHKKNNIEFQPENDSLDYCYVAPQHIPAVNSLCEQFFWPGIDMTETLQYPDFSCVVLYKKIVVGFAFLIPGIGYNESYISFILTRPEWRRAGIATFMLYHLVQTCMGQDITLHVSATNPAIILYQKFGFKVEEFIQDFYEKYMPPNDRQCKHALFLRLSR